VNEGGLFRFPAYEVNGPGVVIDCFLFDGLPDVVETGCGVEAAAARSQKGEADRLEGEAWTPTGFVDTTSSGTMVYEERTGRGTGAQEVHPGI
jgi:hypothetical protein